MNKTIQNMLITLMVLCMPAISQAQRPAGHDDPSATYRLALSLYQKEQYGAAAEAFDKVLKNPPADPDQLQNASAMYYAAVCALELEHDDAGFQIQEFIRRHPGNSLINKAYYQLGRYQFREKRYKEALASFENAEVPELSNEERTAYFYKIGYSYYKTGNPDRAKANLAKVLKSDSPYTPHARYYYAVIAFEQGDNATAAGYFEQLANDRNFKKSAMQYLVQIYHRNGEYEKMLAMATPAYESASGKEKPALALMIGDAYYNGGEYAQAWPYFDFYERTSRRSMGREEAYKVAYTAYMLEDYRTAIRNFQEVTREEDELAQNAYYHLGFCYLKTGEKKYAAGAFSSACRIDIDKTISEDALFNYAKLTMEVANDPYNTAIAALEDYIEKYPGSARIEEAYSYLARLYLTTRNYKQALGSMERIGNMNPALREAYQKICYFRGIELFNEMQYEGATELFKKASELKSDPIIAAQAKYWMGEAFYRQGNEWAAIKYYKAFAEDPNAKNTGIFSNAYYSLGYIYFNKGDYDNAMKWFGSFTAYRGAKESSLESDALVRLGDCHFIRKDYGKAIQYYERAASSGSGSADYALYQKAVTQGASGLFNDKSRTLRELIQRHPGSTYADDAKYELAQTYMIMNRNQDALDVYSGLITDHPGSRFVPKSYLKSGLIYYNESRNDLALKSLKKVAEDYPNTAEAREALNSIRSIYMDQNKVDAYYEYARGLDFAEVTSSEQDSITYIAAENIYMSNNCAEAIRSFGSYLEKFPYGTFSTNARYYKAECELKQGLKEEALAGFEYVSAQAPSTFTENSLLQAARLSIQFEYWEKALDHYSALLDHAENKSSQVEAFEGITTCNMKLERWADAVTAAMMLLSNEKVSDDQILRAHYNMATAYLAMENLENARAEYSITSKLGDNALAAESKYMIAFIDFKTSKFSESENGIFELSDNFGSHDYWVAKGFLLLADVYLARGNTFQAKETLKSIIDNYKGPDLGTIAAAKLEEIERTEQADGADENLNK